jgi:hypothetical protein
LEKKNWDQANGRSQLTDRDNQMTASVYQSDEKFVTIILIKALITVVAQQSNKSS